MLLIFIAVMEVVLPSSDRLSKELVISVDSIRLEDSVRLLRDEEDGSQQRIDKFYSALYLVV